MTAMLLKCKNTAGSTTHMLCTGDKRASATSTVGGLKALWAGASSYVQLYTWWRTVHNTAHSRLAANLAAKGFFGSAEEDTGEGIKHKAEFRLVRDEFGRWIDPTKKAKAAARQGDAQSGRHLGMDLAIWNRPQADFARGPGGTESASNDERHNDGERSPPRDRNSEEVDEFGRRFAVLVRRRMDMGGVALIPSLVPAAPPRTQRPMRR